MSKRKIGLLLCPLSIFLLTGGPPARAAEPLEKATVDAPAFFKNDIIQLTVESISLGRKNQSVQLVLSLENISEQDLNLQLYCPDASITSATGDKYRCVSVEGIVDHWSGNWTNFAAKSRSVIAFSFKADETASPGYYSFSATVSRYVQDKGSTVFSIGIPGIRLDPGVEGHQDR